MAKCAHLPMISGMNDSDSMRAVVTDGQGGPEVLSVRSVPKPVPRTGEIRVRVSTSGINRADLLQRMGKYPVPDGWPKEILGMEFAGVVEALGPDAMRWQVGDPVMGILGGGGYAEYVTTHHSTVVPVPDSVTEEDAGAIPEVFMTALDAAVLQMGLDLRRDPARPRGGEWRGNRRRADRQGPRCRNGRYLADTGEARSRRGARTRPPRCG